MDGKEGAADLIVLLAGKGKSGTKPNENLKEVVSTLRRREGCKNRPMERRERAGTTYKTQGRRDGLAEEWY